MILTEKESSLTRHQSKSNRRCAISLQIPILLAQSSPRLTQKSLVLKLSQARTIFHFPDLQRLDSTYLDRLGLQLNTVERFLANMRRDGNNRWH